MLSTLLQICGAVVLTGTLSTAPLSSASFAFEGDQTTVSLNGAESIVFIGITGDYKAVSDDELAVWLLEEKEIVVVGESIRALSDADRRVWAVKGDDSKKLVKSIKTGLKRKGFKATPLVATALTPLKDNARALKAALRDVERKEKKVWTTWSGGREKVVWVFHESRLDSKKVESLFRKTDAKMTFFHQEFCFKSDFLLEKGGKATEATVTVESFSESAAASMDCLKVSARDGGMVMDMFMRDMSSVLLLRTENGRHEFLCPNVRQSSVKRLAVPELNWTVTLDERTLPFLK